MRHVVAIVYTAFALLAGVALFGRPAHAIPLAFNCVAAGDSDSCAGDARFLVEVVDAPPNGVAFIFSNEGPAQSAIARIYLEDERGSLAGPPEIHQDAPAVIFQSGANPRNLPGATGIAPAFDASSPLAVMAASPHHERGVNPGEHLGLVYSISPGTTFADILGDLSIGNLRLGVQVVGVSGTGDESFVSQLLQ